MGKILNQLKNFDFFSVTYSPAISDGLNYNHSSVLGGIISIILAALSLSYCIYYLYLWFDYQLLPKVTEDIDSFKDDTDFGLLENKMEIIANDINGQSLINPFEKNSIIIMPLILDVNDELNWQPITLTLTDKGTLIINLQMEKDSQFLLIFTRCKEKYLKDDYQCASEAAQQEYFNQNGNNLYTNIEFTTINPSTFESQTYERTYPIFVHSQAEMCSQTTLHYQLNHNLIDRAYIFESPFEVHNYISDTLNYPQYASKSYCDSLFMPDTYGAFWILFQQQYHTVQIAYPPISEVFAAIGSIISILFSVKYVITLLNLTQMRQSVLDDIMGQYYPEIRQFKILKNIWGKINSVKFRGLEVEIPSYLAFQKQIHSQMACKLNYKNLLYEMSRFQFIIMSMKRRSEIEKVHNVGIKVPLQLSESGESYVIARGYQNQLKTLNMRHMNTISSKFEILNMDDALILSTDHKKYKSSFQTEVVNDNQQLTQNQIQKEDAEKEIDFYDINDIKLHNEGNDNNYLES